MKDKKLLYRMIIPLFMLLMTGNLYAQNNVSVFTIENAQSINFQKDKEGNEEIIVLTGNVYVTVSKDGTKTEIRAEKITFNRATDMLYASGNVSLKQTGSSAAGGMDVTANSLLFNTTTLEGVFDNGRAVQTQSDAINLPSGSTLIVASKIFGRDSSSTIAFKDALLTFCDDENPHWRIKASRIWLLPGGEFAFLNAVLYVGELPVLPLPAFYYPKDELVFNPVFGNNQRLGWYVQTTTYIKGRKPLDSSGSSSGSDDDVSQALFNFMKSTKQKEQVREGLVLHNLDSDYKAESSDYIKILADYYTNLGFMAGAEAVLKPEKIFTNIEAGLRLGFSSTIYQSNGSYTPFSPTGNIYYESSNFMGLTLPFRYSGNLKLSMNKPFSLTLSLPLYSDPSFYKDFNTRQESMDWIGYLMSGVENEDTTASSSELSSFTWSLSGSYNFNVPKKLSPYITNLSISTAASQVTWSSKTRSNGYDRDRNPISGWPEELIEGKDSYWKNYTSQKSFYYPSLVTPFKLSAKMSGTLVSVNSRKSSSQKSATLPFELEMPDIFKDEQQLAAEKAAKEKKEAEKAAKLNEENQSNESNPSENKENSVTEQKTEAPDNKSTENKSASSNSPENKTDENEPELLLAETELPKLESSSVTSSVTTFEGLNYTLTYSIAPDFSSNLNYDTTYLFKPEDFSLLNYKTNYIQIKAPITLTSNLGYRGSFLSLRNSFVFTPLYQTHIYPEDTTETEESQVSMHKTDYTASKLDLSNTNSFSIRPFIYNKYFKNTGLDWNTTIKWAKLDFLADEYNVLGDEARFNYLTVVDGFKDEMDNGYSGDFLDDYITVHTLTATISAVEGKYSQNLAISTKLWPQDDEYNATLSLKFPSVTFSASEGIKLNTLTDEEGNTYVDGHVWNPLQQSLNVSLFSDKKDKNGNPQTLSLTESFSYNWGSSTEEQYLSSLRFSASWQNFQVAFTGQYTYGYTFNKEVGWESDTEKGFHPVSLSFAYSPKTKTFRNWKNRIVWAPSLNTSIVYDCLRPTNSYFKFIPSITFKINDFLDLTFSAESKNSTIYKYMKDLPFYNSDISYGNAETNPFWDLLNSFGLCYDIDGDGDREFFAFEDNKARKASSYKLQSLSISLTHKLCDWDFSATCSVKPRVVNDGSGYKYDFSPYVTISVIWKPLPSMKTQITDNYGTWELNSSSTQ